MKLINHIPLTRQETSFNNRCFLSLDKYFSSFKQNNGDIEKIKSEGDKLMKEGNFMEASKKYTCCINTSKVPNHIHHINRALSSFKLNGNLAAIKDCDEAIQINPKCIKAYMLKARA